MNFDLRAHTVLLVVAGSRAYGTHIASSDVDLKGVAIAPREVLFGYRHTFEQCDDAAQVGVFRDLLMAHEGEAADRLGLEGSVYDVRKLVTLAVQANPNILDILFCRDEEVRLHTPIGARLREQRGLFVTQKARQTFAGYASAQLKRIKNHRAWLLSPPEGAPTRAGHGLPETPLVPRQQLEAAEAAIRKQVDTWELDLENLEDADRLSIRSHVAATLGAIASQLGFPSPEAVTWHAGARSVGLGDDLIEALKRERSYRSAQRAFKQYQQWKAHRNPARAALEAAHGYDTKHGAHLVRLLRMGREILQTGRVHVWRGPSPTGPADAPELRAIRDGAWSYDALVDYAEELNRELDAVVAEGRAVVPPGPDREAIDALCVSLVEEALVRT